MVILKIKFKDKSAFKSLLLIKKFETSGFDSTI